MSTLPGATWNTRPAGDEDHIGNQRAAALKGFDEAVTLERRNQ